MSWYRWVLILSPFGYMVETKREIRSTEKQSWVDQVIDSMRWMDLPDSKKYEIALRLGARPAFHHPLSVAAREEQSVNEVQDVTEIRYPQSNQALRKVDSDV